MLHQHQQTRKMKRRSWLPPLSETVAASLLVVSDTAAVIGTGMVTYLGLIRYSTAQDLYIAAITFVWLSTLILMHFGGLYRYDVATRPLRYLPAIAVAVSTACLFLLAAAFSIKVAETFSRLWFGTFALSSIATISACRLGLAWLFQGALEQTKGRRRLAVVGSGAQAARLMSTINQVRHRPVEVSGLYDLDHDVDEKRTKATLDRLETDVRTGNIDDVVIALPWSEDDRIMAIMTKLRELPVNVYLASDLIGFRTQFKAPPSHFGSLPLFQVIGKPMSGWDAVIKAMEDYILGGLITLLLSPVLILIALGVLISSGRPILFRQKRLGYNNEVFDCFKFRSMRPDADIPGKTKQATKDDDRITPFGRFIRRWSLDELPQLFNVLNGTMSLVGPRPHALDHNDEFAQRTKDYFARHRVKPGITGLAQVKGFRGPTDTDEKLEGRIRNDIFYAENWSLSLDIQILARTVVVCLFGKNAY
jgi:Undecaprenyl-phosphate glucose phosphotransferase